MFGSICYGSLFVALIQALRKVVSSIKQFFVNVQTNIYKNCIIDGFMYLIDSFLFFIEKAFVYFNKFAFCYVAAYGMDFKNASKKVSELFEERFFYLIFII
jgi:hypothetical protein